MDHHLLHTSIYTTTRHKVKNLPFEAVTATATAAAAAAAPAWAGGVTRSVKNFRIL